jgi:hypothetical protein
MSRINLLPDHFVARQRRAALATRVACAAVLAIMMGTAWGAIAQAQLSARATQVASSRAQLEQEQQRAVAIEQRAAECRALRALLAHRGQLESPVASAGVLTLLTHLLPESVALTRLSLDVPDPDMTDRSAKAAAAAAPPPAQLTHVVLEGLAMSDVGLTQVVSSLAAQKAFANVKLVRCRQVPLEDTTRFGFEITLDVAAAASGGSVALDKPQGPRGERGA